MKTINKIQVDGQGELALGKRAEPNSMPVETVRSKRNKGAAFTLACDSSNLLDKEISGHPLLNIDPGYFSKMKSGTATLDADMLKDFCWVVNNTIYADWLAWQLGCALMLVKSEAEKRIERLEQQVSLLELEKRTLVNAMHGRVASVQAAL